MIPQPVNVPIGNKYLLIREYICPISGVIVERGFVYDGASIHRSLWTITGIRPDGPYRAGATVHDRIYRRCGRVRVRVGGSTEIQTLSRSMADRIFRDLLAGAGISSYRRYLAWSGVRLFGWMAWNKNRNK
jgi:hypothetical protein